MKTIVYILIFLCLIILFASPLNALQQSNCKFTLPHNTVEKDTQYLYPRYQMIRPRIGLSLSGGGARGIAQIGVLRVFEDTGIPIDFIVGTSMGNIVGGLFASGYTSEEIWQITKNIEWSEIIQDKPPRGSLFLSQKQVRERQFIRFRIKDFKPFIPSAISPGQKLYTHLSQLVLQAPFHAIQSYDDLRIPFRSIATDLVSGKQVVFNKGDLAQVMLGSSAIPLLFSAVQIDSFQLLDGGILENIPMNTLLHNNIDMIIAVDTSSPLRSREEIRYPWQLADQVTTIMQKKQKERAYQKADILIAPKLHHRTNTDFDSLESAYRAGVRAAKEMLPKIQTMIEKRRNRLIGNDSAKWRISSEQIIGTMQNQFHEIVPKNKKMWVKEDGLRTLEKIYQTGTVNKLSADISPTRDSTYVVKFYVKPYPVLQDIQFLHQHLLPDSLLLDCLNNKAGERFNICTWQSDREKILRLYRQNDYAMATITKEEIDPESGILKISIDEGRIASIELSGNQHVRDFVVLREYPLKTGDIFKQSLAQNGIQNIFSTGLFDRVQPEYLWENQKLHIRINLSEKPTLLFQTKYNYSRNDRMQVQCQLIDNNIMGLGNRLIFSGILGKRRQEGRIQLQTDRMFQSFLSSTFETLYWKRKHYLFKEGEIFGEYQERRTGIHTSIGQQLQRVGLVSLQLRLEQVALQQVFGSGYPITKINQTSLRLQSIVDDLDRMPFPTRGRYHLFYYEISSELLGNRVPFFKLYSSLESYYTFFRRWTFHPRIIWATADLTTPHQEMYMLGGQESFFGFRKEEKLGRRLFQTSAEIRYLLPSKLPISTYFSLRYDFGAIWKDSLEEIVWGDFMHGIGGTIAIDSILGVFSLSYGANNAGRKEYYFNLGFKF